MKMKLPKMKLKLSNSKKFKKQDVVGLLVVVAIVIEEQPTTIAQLVIAYIDGIRGETLKREAWVNLA